MSEPNMRRRATVHDVARTAGVSLATVDRVLNLRPGVRQTTIDRVAAAIAAIGFQRDLSASLLARARDIAVVFLIPDGTNEFMDGLTEAVSRRAAAASGEKMHVQAQRVTALDPQSLAAALDRLDAERCDCAVIVAEEHALVLAAVDAATRRGIKVLTLVSDLPGSTRQHFIGIDNGAAGRTAAALMGRFLPQGGVVGVIVGSLQLRDHADRLAGFSATLARHFPTVALLGPLEGHDDGTATQKLVAGLLESHADLTGIYNLGAGNGGLVAALEASRRSGQIRVIAHELTAPTRQGLASGAIDVVLDQNPDGEIRAAIGAARALALGEIAAPLADPIEIGIFLRDNLR